MNCLTWYSVNLAKILPVSRLNTLWMVPTPQTKYLETAAITPTKLCKMLFLPHLVMSPAQFRLAKLSHIEFDSHYKSNTPIFLKEN